MTTLRLSFLAAVLVQTCLSANLAVSTYFKDGFGPTAIASDAQGNILVAGSAVIDPVAQTTGAAVAKLNPQASQYVYLTYLDSAASYTLSGSGSAASDTLTAITVDSAGNAYVAGWTTNGNFPVVGGGSLGTPPSSALDPRSFVIKLSPDGEVLFSVLIGGSVGSQAKGIALTPQGQILVSGLATASGFLSTRGAYNVTDSSGNWFLMELDPTASTVIFSATGIGGSSIALDSAGNIYLAGSSVGTNYPTTPGAYQTTFVQGNLNIPGFPDGFPGGLQHITKVDSTGSTLIYSTGLNDITGAAGGTTNTGLAVDAAGDAFVTGTLFEAVYPLTVPAPSSYSGYLSKLDPTGSSLLFSVPEGGGGVALDSFGTVYTGGIVAGYSAGSYPGTTPVAPPAIFSWVPQQCWPDNVVAYSEAYVMKVDPATGDALDAQWIDGSAPTAVGITLAGGNVWITGSTPALDIPLTPDLRETLVPAALGTGFAPGAYVAAVDFSTSPAAGTPVIACVVDAANLEHVRAVGPYQLLTLFGENLGPSTGVAAPDGTDPSVAGVAVSIDGVPAPLLYVSSSQINLEVPANAFPIVAVTVNGKSSSARQFLPASTNLNLFANLASSEIDCLQGDMPGYGFQPLAMNADGSLNSCTNPAKLGSTVSFFVEGGSSLIGAAPPAVLPELQAFVGGGCPEPVNTSLLANGFVYQADVQLPTSIFSCVGPPYNGTAFFAVTFSFNGAGVGPLAVPPPPNVVEDYVPGQPMPMVVWVTQ